MSDDVPIYDVCVVCVLRNVTSGQIEEIEVELMLKHGHPVSMFKRLKRALRLLRYSVDNLQRRLV